MDKNATNVEQFFVDLFDQIVENDQILNPDAHTYDTLDKDQWSISKETFLNAIGGEDFVK
jgi:hypothetical protein